MLRARSLLRGSCGGLELRPHYVVRAERPVDRAANAARPDAVKFFCERVNRCSGFRILRLIAELGPDQFKSETSACARAPARGKFVDFEVCQNDTIRSASGRVS